MKLRVPKLIGLKNQLLTSLRVNRTNRLNNINIRNMKDEISLLYAIKNKKYRTVTKATTDNSILLIETFKQIDDNRMERNSNTSKK